MKYLTINKMKSVELKGSPVRGLTGATLGFFFGSAAISLFGPSASRLKEAMDLDPAMLGLLVAIPSLSGSLLRIPFGAWVDTTGGKKPFLILLVLSIIGLGGLSLLLHQHYPDSMQGYYGLVLVLGCLSGCGIATFSVGVGQTSYWYPKQKQGFPLGVFAGIGTMAAGVFALVLPLFLQAFGLISAYFAWTVFLLIGTLLYLVIGQNAYSFQYEAAGYSAAESRKAAEAHGQEMFPTGSIKQSLLLSAKVPATWILVASYFSTFGGFLALTAWFPTYWQQYFEVDAIKAGLLTAIFSVSSALLRVPGGMLSDKIGGLKVGFIALILLLGATLLMGFTSHPVAAFVWAMVIAVAFGMNNAAVFKLVPFYVPQSVGGASGWVGGLGAFGGFVIPPVMGWVVGWLGPVGYARGFMVFSLLALVNLGLIYLGLMKKGPRIVPYGN